MPFALLLTTGTLDRIKESFFISSFMLDDYGSKFRMNAHSWKLGPREKMKWFSDLDLRYIFGCGKTCSGSRYIGESWSLCDHFLI